MLCDICRKNEAVLFIEQSSLKETRKFNICAECAATRGITPDNPVMHKTLAAIFTELSTRAKKEALRNDRACPVCGLRLSKFLQKGTLGCPECYMVFKDEIFSYMKNHNIQGKYTGSMPHRLSSFRSTLTDRTDCQMKLDDAIKNEDYEKAAFYRDYLNAIEKKSIAIASDEDKDEKTK